MAGEVEERGFADVMVDAIGAMFPEKGGTMDRVITQGSAELASALFGGSDAYVAYGDGQKAVEVDAPQIQPEQPVQAVEARRFNRNAAGWRCSNRSVFHQQHQRERTSAMTLGELAFYGFVVWMVYMMTFRHKQFMELNEHMKGNVKDAKDGASKAAGVGMKVLGCS